MYGLATVNCSTMDKSQLSGVPELEVTPHTCIAFMRLCGNRTRPVNSFLILTEVMNFMPLTPNVINNRRIALQQQRRLNQCPPKFN